MDVDRCHRAGGVRDHRQVSAGGLGLGQTDLGLPQRGHRLLQGHLGAVHRQLGLDDLILQGIGVNGVQGLTCRYGVPLLEGTLRHGTADSGDDGIVVGIGHSAGILHPVLHRAGIRLDGAILVLAGAGAAA